MKRVLILFTSSFPFGRGESFLGYEFPHLAAAFEQIVIVSNDLESDFRRDLPGHVRSLRRPYVLSRREKLFSLLGLLRWSVWVELWTILARYRMRLSRDVVATVLLSWFKAGKFSRVIRDIAREHPGSQVFAYSYWANDMAVAAARARRRGWVDRALCRAHGWDVYFERADAGFLPFRTYLARHLDHYLFVSRDGLRYSEELMDGEDPGSLGHSRLGTPAVIDRPLGRRRPFTVVSCSRMVPLKRVDLVARALPRVEGEVRWIHLGDGPAREAVEEICRHLPERIDVDLRGQVPNPEVLECYRASRPSVFVNVSTFEGLPVSIMEAMSAGIPVIATDVGGVSEIVRDGENGRLLAGDPSPADVGEALGDVAGMSDEDYRRHARLAWETWRRSFHAEENFGEFLRTILAAPTADRGPGPA